jgi:membrane-bound serine protease (ClpP class)
VLSDGRVLATHNPVVVTIRPNLRERLLNLLADPNLVYVLFILGLYGLIYEFFHPGIGFGLAVGGTCLVLAFLGLQILPVNVVGVVLILFGIGLVVLDAFTPTNGILTAGGIVALLAGSLTLFDIPDPRVGLSWATVFSVIGITTLFFAFVISKALLIQRKRPASGQHTLVGRIGTVRSELHPDGAIFVRGEYWKARSLDGTLSVGTPIRVEKIEQNTLLVRRVR